jgi:hypothetical protein
VVVVVTTAADASMANNIVLRPFLRGNCNNDLDLSQRTPDCARQILEIKPSCPQAIALVRSVA